MFSTVCEVLLDYRPKAVGKQTLIFTANGITKTVDISVVPYVKIDPTIQDIKNQDLSLGETTLAGSFRLSEADEKVLLEGGVGVLSDKQLTSQGFRYDSDIKDAGVFTIHLTADITNKPIYRIYVNNNKGYTGAHSFVLKEIKLLGIHSGLYRYVSGLPATFVFEVK